MPVNMCGLAQETVERKTVAQAHVLPGGPHDPPPPATGTLRQKTASIASHLNTLQRGPNSCYQ